MIWVGDEQVDDDGRVRLKRNQEPVVSGPDLVAVSCHGVAWLGSSEVRLDGSTCMFFEPPPGQADAIRKTGATLPLDVATSEAPDRPTRVLVERVGRLLSEEELQGLRDALRHLAWSAARRHALRGELVSTEGARPDLASLVEALAANLPALLDRPLVEQRLEPGAVAVARARQTPQTLLAQRLRGPRALVLERRRVVAVVETDYAWLAALVRRAEQEASLATRAARTGEVRADAEAQAWAERRRSLRGWLRNPHLASAARNAPSQPSWVLTQSVPGAAIVRAARGSHLRAQAATRASHRGQRLVSLVDDGRLYEIWVVLETIELLRARFGFEVEDEDALFRLKDDLPDAPLLPVRLTWRGASLSGKPQEVVVDVVHEPSLPRRNGRTDVKPDLALYVSCEGRRTLHLLDAKCKSQPSSDAHEVARAYHQSIAERPLASFVVSPTPAASLLRFISRARRTLPAGTTLHDQRATDVHGLAWGHLYGRPPEPPRPALATSEHEGLTGLLQFLVLALKYHRHELRHVCVECGRALGMADVSVSHAASPEAILASHEDRLSEGRLAADAGLTLSYTCPGCAARGVEGSRWVRAKCKNGHVLLRHGQLTPHVRRDEKDTTDPLGHHVECLVCGQYRDTGVVGRKRRRKPRAKEP